VAAALSRAQLRFKDENGNPYQDWNGLEEMNCLDNINPIKSIIQNLPILAIHSGPKVQISKRVD